MSQQVVTLHFTCEVWGASSEEEAVARALRGTRWSTSLERWKFVGGDPRESQ